MGLLYRVVVAVRVPVPMGTSVLVNIAVGVPVSVGTGVLVNVGAGVAVGGGYTPITSSAVRGVTRFHGYNMPSPLFSRTPVRTCSIGIVHH